LAVPVDLERLVYEALMYSNEVKALRTVPVVLDIAVIAADDSGYVYVADTINNRVQKFTNTGTFVTKWGSSGSTKGLFDSPYALAADAAGHVYVADAGNDRVQKFDSDGTFLRKWGTSGSGDGQLANPLGIAVDTQGHVYVADSGNNRIEKFDNNGRFLTGWGAAGTDDGQFSGPLGVAVDANGNVAIAGRVTDRLTLTATGGGNDSFVSKYDAAGTEVFTRQIAPVLERAWSSRRASRSTSPERGCSRSARSAEHAVFHEADCRGRFARRQIHFGKVFQIRHEEPEHPSRLQEAQEVVFIDGATSPAPIAVHAVQLFRRRSPGIFAGPRAVPRRRILDGELIQQVSIGEAREAFDPVEVLG
jgi:DNA-binding beta-propeller fold protein YncE